MATIENLSPEIVLEIFSHYVRSEGHEAFLRNIPRVCKEWNKLSSDSSLWRDVRSNDWNFLLNVSRKGFLYRTKRLEIFVNRESFSEMDLSPLLKNIRDLKALEFKGNAVAMSGNAIIVVAEHCPHLERFCLDIEQLGNAMSHEWNQFLTECGPTLKHLELRFSCSREARRKLVSRIAAKCPLLERFYFSLNYKTPFPIHELRSGCPGLKELEISCCQVITAGMNDSLGFGFKDLKKFKANFSDFNSLDVYTTLKDSVDLEHLELFGDFNLVVDNISKIPSDKVRILDISIIVPDEISMVLGDAVFKWRRTLSVLHLSDWKGDIGYVLKRLLHDNPNPKLESLVISKDIGKHFLEEFLQKCQSLIHLKINGKKYKGREKIKHVLDFYKKRR